MKLQANAKLNLFLRVRGVLQDGYHELSTFMHEISLHDSITIEPSDSIAVDTGGSAMPDGDLNTAYKAAKIYGRGASIKIIKRIPAAAGLGGGSSDAAAVLRALNAQYGLYDDRRLAELALSIGADVPFSLVGKTCLCRNKGEVITPVTCGKKLWFVVARGERRLLTAQVFEAYDVLAKEREAMNLEFFGLPMCYFNKTERFRTEEQAMLSALASGDVKKIAKEMRNDLEDAAISLAPEVYDTKRILSDSGAAGALMTGSGSACFGLYHDEDVARRALEYVSGRVKFARVCCSVL